jgi:hypothetical protein
MRALPLHPADDVVGQVKRHEEDLDDGIGHCSAARFKRPSESAGPVTNRWPKTISRSQPRQPGGKLNAQLNVVRHELASMGVT